MNKQTNHDVEAHNAQKKETAVTDEGESLRQARMDKGLSLEMVHGATKIPMDALRAIEEGYKVRTLSPFYYHSFVKKYAQYLDVQLKYRDGTMFKPALAKKQKEMGESLLDRWFEVISSPVVKKWAAIVITGLVGVFLIFKLATLIVGWVADSTHKRVASVKQVEDQEQEVQKQQTRETKPTVARTPVSAMSKEGEAAAAGVSLTIRTRKDSWLRVKADDVIVFQTTLKGGAVETWNAENKIEISGRNINELEYEVNGKLIGMLGRKDHNAKHVVITADGLKVVE